MLGDLSVLHTPQIVIRSRFPSERALGYRKHHVALRKDHVRLVVYHGDARLAERFGSVRVLATGFAMVIASLLVMIVIPTPVTLFAALFIMGLGIANAAPLLISNAAHDPTVNQSSAVTTVTTVGYAGLMAGPALIGFLAHATSLKGAFLCIVVLMSLASIIAHNWRRRFHSPERA